MQRVSFPCFYLLIVFPLHISGWHWSVFDDTCQVDGTTNIKVYLRWSKYGSDWNCKRLKIKLLYLSKKIFIWLSTYINYFQVSKFLYWLLRWKKVKWIYTSLLYSSKTLSSDSLKLSIEVQSKQSAKLLNLDPFPQYITFNCLYFPIYLIIQIIS